MKEISNSNKETVHSVRYSNVLYTYIREFTLTGLSSSFIIELANLYDVMREIVFLK